MTQRRAGAAVAVLSMALSALVLLYATAVLTATGQALDTAAMTGVSDILGADAGWAELLLEIVSPATLLLATGMLAWSTRQRRERVAALVVSTVALGPALVAHVLKDVLVRPQLLADAASNSLPSGHVAAVAGLAGAAWIATDREWRPATAALGVLVVAATGLATITLGWHRPSDVIASSLVALAAVALASWRPTGRPARTSIRRASTGMRDV